MSARGLLLIGITLATLSPSMCCDLGNATSRTLCVKELLEAGRDSKKTQVDPLSLQDTTGLGELEEWKVQNPSVTGLGNYSFENLHVDVLNRSVIRINFDLTWPTIILGARGSYVFCNRIPTRSGGTRNSCVGLAGEVAITVSNPAGSGNILLELSLNNSQVHVEPISQFSVNFSDIVVDFSMNQQNQKLAKRFGSPSPIFKRELSSNYWKNTAEAMVEDEIVSHLKEVADVYIPARLGSRLIGFSG